jgi:hypothetical protein
MVALAPSERGWTIIAAAANLEQLVEDLRCAGTDLSQIVFDQVHLNEHTAAGIELK